MIKHIVLFRFKAAEDKEIRMKEIKTQLEKLQEIIPELKEIHVGLNVNPAEQWDLSLEVVTEDMEKLKIYANHPAHQAILKEQISPLLEERACVDYKV